MRIEWFFIWTNLNPFHPRIHCGSFCWNVVLEKRIFKFCQCIFAILCLSPLEKGRGPSFTNLESPSPQDAFCQVWLKLVRGSWEEDFWIMSMFFCYFVIISPWKGWIPWFEQPWIFFIKGSFVPSLVDIGLEVLEKKIFKSCQCTYTFLQLSPLGKENGPSFEQTWIPFI